MEDKAELGIGIEMSKEENKIFVNNFNKFVTALKPLIPEFERIFNRKFEEVSKQIKTKEKK